MIFFFFGFFLVCGSGGCFKTELHYVDQTGFQFAEIYLPLPPKHSTLPIWEGYIFKPTEIIQII